MCGGNKRIFSPLPARCQESAIHAELLVFHRNPNVLDEAGGKVQLAQGAPSNHRGDEAGDADTANQPSRTKGGSVDVLGSCYKATRPLHRSHRVCQHRCPLSGLPIWRNCSNAFGKYRFWGGFSLKALSNFDDKSFLKLMPIWGARAVLREAFSNCHYSMRPIATEYY